MTEKQFLESLKENRAYWIEVVKKEFGIEDNSKALEAIEKATHGVIFSLMCMCDGVSAVTNFRPIKLKLNGTQLINNSGKEMHDEWCKIT